MPRVTITVPEKNAQPYRFQLDRQVVTLGRGEENDIVIDSGSVSVHHAEMRRVEGGYELHDIGSTNGIKLDGIRYEVIPLSTGINVTIGDVAFDFSLTEEESEMLARECPRPLPVISEPEAVAQKPKPVSYSAGTSSHSGFVGNLVFLIFAAAAFFAGLEIRYQKETGHSLIAALLEKKDDAKASPSPEAPPVK